LSELSQTSQGDTERFLAIEDDLDQCSELFRVLHHRPLADRLMSALDWLEADVRGWQIHAACIMPSHIHIVMRNGIGRSGELEKDLAAVKNYTARVCNEELGRAGRFWAKESFDHWCRDEESVRRSVAYTLRNPVRANLVASVSDWPWNKIGAAYEEFAKEL